MRAHKRLQQDELAYSSYIGKYDKPHTLAALHDGGKDTILRVCMSPQEQLPFRVLGYLAALEHIGREYLPHAQKQFVVSLHAADRVNGTSQKAIDTALDFFTTAWLHVPRHASDATSRTLFLFDKPEQPFVNENRLERIMRHSPQRERLEKQAAKRGTSYIPYLAAHIALHDVVDSVYTPSPLHTGREQAWPTAKRIISLGAKSEQPFYEARMRCRELNLHVDGMVEQTGQIFTQHNLPPYSFRRQSAQEAPLFDPSFDDIDAVMNPALDDPFVVRFDTVIRDNAYVLRYSRSMYQSHSTVMA